MDYDPDWSINFWMINKKFAKHCSVRRSVDMYVYNLNLTKDTCSPQIQQFITHNTNIQLLPITAKHKYRYRISYSNCDHCFEKTVSLLVPVELCRDYYNNMIKCNEKDPFICLKYDDTETEDQFKIKVNAGKARSSEGDIYDP